MAIIGAILGDIAGSQFEFDRIDINKADTSVVSTGVLPRNFMGQTDWIMKYC